MELKPIKTKKEYEAFLGWIDDNFNRKVKVSSAEGQQVQVALLLVKQYEDENYPIPTPDPIEAIKLKMQEKGIQNKDLVGLIGSKGYVSSLLNGKKPITLQIAKIFHQKLGVPAEVFLRN